MFRSSGVGPGLPEAWAQPSRPSCEHVGSIVTVPEPIAVCPGCAVNGDEWVHLRQCLTCGRVGCCNASQNQHAHRHFEETGHPLMRSIEPGETWRWCWIDEIEV